MQPVNSDSKKRQVSLDVFRGITIAMMIIVNNQGDWSHVYPVLRHAAWHGWNGADIVFPFFLFVMGGSIPLSMAPRRDRGEGRAALLLKVLRRTAILLALGLVLNLFPAFEFSSMRIPGVLQRIALCYLIVSLTFICMDSRGRWFFSLIILAGYGALLYFVPPPGSALPSMTPDLNWCRGVDSFFLGTHTYRHAIVSGFDPEGILSTLPAAVSAMAGLFTTGLLKADISENKKTARLVIAAILCTTVGLMLGRWIPVNKNLWTPSYVLFMTGLALAVLLPLRWILDRRGFTRWSLPFLVLGTNALPAYILSSALGKFLAVTAAPVLTAGTGAAAVTLKSMIHSRLYVPWLNPYPASLGYATGFLIFWILAMAVLYRKRIFIRI